MHGARGGMPQGKRNGNYRHGARTKATIELWRFMNLLGYLAQMISKLDARNFGIPFPVSLLKLHCGEPR
jgi:hypothetical protein